MTRDDNPQSAGEKAVFDMRSFLELLKQSGELTEISSPIELGQIAEKLDAAEPAVLFSNVGKEGSQLVGNVAGSRSRLALAFDTDEAGLLQTVLARLANPQGATIVDRSDAPAQEVVLTGDDADFTTLPIHLQHGMDGGPYVSSSMDIVLDPRNGLTNVGIRRLMVRGRREAGVDLVAPSDLRAIYEHFVSQGEHLPVAFIVGSHPVDHVAATMRIPVDEMELMASLRGQSMPVVKCVTNDIMVPADAEYVLEGYFDCAGHVEAEGPYGEFLGYYGGVKMNPVFHLTAVTHRKDPIFQTSTIAGANIALTDSAQLIALRTEVTVWRALETAIREPLNLHATTASGGMYNIRVSMRQRVPGEARNAIAACFGSLANVKHVFIFDPDIDIFSDAQCDWAFATRLQAERDIVIQSGFRTLPLDPSLAGARVGSKAGFDCTMPIEVARSIESKVPAPPKFEGARFDSVEQAMEDGPKTFEQLMVAIDTLDGREILPVFDDLRKSGRLGRDGDGRWLLKDVEDQQ
ncbi:MAG: carboxylyase [Hyphomicrobiales bacterium]|nr:MAG: carboxylyase [Hyphomicrobiales bacterium]